MASDPFTLVYDAMIAEFKKVSKNVVSWNSNRLPEPDVIVEGCLPEIQLRPKDTLVQLGSKSCGTDVQKNYDVLINSGDQRIGEELYPTEWNVLKVLHNLKYGPEMQALQFNGRSFVDTVEVTAVTGGLSNQTENRGIVGWVALWTIEVRMQFSGEDLTL